MKLNSLEINKNALCVYAVKFIYERGISMLNQMKVMANRTMTENGAITLNSTLDDCVNLFAIIGSLRDAEPARVLKMFRRAFIVNPTYALRILFYARDVRGGLGERKVFRLILGFVANNYPDSIIKNIELIAEYGRFDDLMELLGTKCEKAMVSYIKNELKNNIVKMEHGESISLISKWLPSVNASNPVQKQNARKMAKLLKMKECEYRRTLSKLNKHIDILETHLCEKDYTFDYEKQPSKALFKYRAAFARNDEKRYSEFIEKAKNNPNVLKTSSLYPYEIIRELFKDGITKEEADILDATWNSLPTIENNKNAIAVIDGSGSMYWNGEGLPMVIALSLGIYFAEHNNGYFKNHFITFSEKPQLVEIKGDDIYSKVAYCMTYNEVANTNVMNVFALILKTAIENKLPQSELPESIYIISDMEFDRCAKDADATIFEAADQLYKQYGYKLPNVVFWNVQSCQENFPVSSNEQGVALVSGASPNLFNIALSQDMSPYAIMIDVIESERYNKIVA